ncbi:alpha-tocopherol transfer protein-like [Littorina saxatilis]|uniref:CRAL-TRIO domain-containing protein n=1 Tax=Littorina saxatilis TaxID=31220 RepID=A0AAN9ARY0_9CAEN
MANKDKFEYKCTLKPETLEIAKKELNEDPDTRMLELKAFRDRLQQYPGLRPRLDPQFLIKFLRSRKFDQEKAFELMLNYYRMRKEDPEIFTGLKPSNVLHVYKSHMSYPHTHRDKLGRRVYLIFPARMDTTHYTAAEAFKTEFINLNKMSEDEESQVRGYTLLIDYKDFGMSHFMQLNLAFGKRVGKIWQDTFPARMKNCLIVNEPHFIDLVMGLFTQFMKDKLVNRIRRLGTDWKKLHEYIDPACLPPEYGGTLTQEPDPEAWVQTLVQSDHEMEEESKYGFVDYTIGHETNKKDQDAITNMAGTFRKLNV